MNNWQGDLSQVEQQPLQANSLPTGNGIFTFLKLSINGAVGYRGVEETEAQTILVRSYT